MATTIVRDKIILLQHDIQTPTEHLIEAIAKKKLIGIKLVPRSKKDLPSPRLVKSAAGVILLDAPSPLVQTDLFRAEIDLARNLNCLQTAILSLGSGCAIADPTHGATVSQDELHIGWFPVGLPKEPPIAEIFLPTKIFVHGSQFVSPPDKARTLFSCHKKEISAYVSKNLMSLNFVSCLDHKTYLRVLEKTRNITQPASTKRQTFEELKYHGDLYLTNYINQMKNLIEYWIDQFIL